MPNGIDLILADPATGELLAAVSRRAGKTRSLTAITEPYEPGSTIKTFTVAAALAAGVIRANEQINCAGDERPNRLVIDRSTCSHISNSRGSSACSMRSP